MKKVFAVLALIPAIALSHPHVCPKASEIKAMGINTRCFEDSDHHWYCGRSDLQYGTDDHWTFVILDVKADTNAKAYAKASTALKLLAFQSGPTQGRTQEEVYCQYQAGKFSAVTISPPLKNPSLANEFTSYASS